MSFANIPGRAADMASEQMLAGLKFAEAVSANRAKEQPHSPGEPSSAIAHVPPVVAVAETPSQHSWDWDSSLEPCDGEYPPCYRAKSESGGDYNAYNPTGCYSEGRSGCYGKWQFGWFWAGKLGLPLDLSTATPAQQDAAARELWNHGAGCSNWAAC